MTHVVPPRISPHRQTPPLNRGFEPCPGDLRNTFGTPSRTSQGNPGPVGNPSNHWHRACISLVLHGAVQVVHHYRVTLVWYFGTRLVQLLVSCAVSALCLYYIVVVRSLYWWIGPILALLVLCGYSTETVLVLYLYCIGSALSPHWPCIGVVLMLCRCRTCSPWVLCLPCVVPVPIQ